VPAAFLSAVSTVLAEDVSQLTGGFVSGTLVRYREFGAGTRIFYPQDALSDGAITIAYIEDGGNYLSSARTTLRASWAFLLDTFRCMDWRRSRG
jgi:hypothetical protein